MDIFPSEWRLCVVKFKLKEKQKSITNPNHVKPLRDQHQVREGFPNISGTGSMSNLNDITLKTECEMDFPLIFNQTHDIAVTLHHMDCRDLKGMMWVIHVTVMAHLYNRNIKMNEEFK